MSTNAQLFERAQASIPGGVNSPVRAFRAVGGTPRFIARAQGPYMWDAEGRRYIDYIGSWGPMILGHGHPAVLEAAGRVIVVEIATGDAVAETGRDPAVVRTTQPAAQRRVHCDQWMPSTWIFGSRVVFSGLPVKLKRSATMKRKFT